MSPSTKKHYVNYLNNMQGYVKIYECRAHEHTIKLTNHPNLRQQYMTWHDMLAWCINKIWTKF